LIDLTPIFKAARQAALLCQEVQRRHIVKSEKSGHEPVTIADYGSQAIICRAIRQHFPDDAVLSEEAGSQFLDLVSAEQRAYIIGLISEILREDVTEAEVVTWLDQGKAQETARMWVVDPIDGTKGFLGQRHYVNAIGIMHDRKPVAGLLSAPEYPGYQGGALLYAQDGEAFIESLEGDGGDKRRITVSDRVDTATLRGLESIEKSHTSHERLARVRDAAGMNETLLERADSQEKYGRIAAGDAEVYLRLPRVDSTRPHSIWDHAPGAAIVEAAGGKVTDVDGSPLDYSKGKSLQNEGIVVTNGKVHDRLVAAVQQALQAE
jgi:3'(2'), 5'-bisphosphate nucleotidase